MIWLAENTEIQNREALRHHLAADLRRTCLALRVTLDQVDEIAGGVAAYCADDLDLRAMPSELLRILVCRSLCAAGKEEIAAHLLSEREPSRREGVHLLPALRRADCPPAVWRLCAAGWIRPVSWLCHEAESSWVVDLRRFPAGNTLDLEVYPLLRRVLDQLAALWDKTAGQGTLAVAGLDVLDFCRDVLVRLQNGRGWSHVPAVIRLNLPPHRAARRARP